MKKSYIIALLIAIIAVLWIASSAILPVGNVANDINEDNDVMEADASLQQKTPMRVQVKTIRPSSYAKTVRGNGRSAASRNVTLRAEAEGQVISVIAKEGDRVSKGDKIVSIDIRERRERVSEARELLKQRQIEFDAAKKLKQQGYASDVRLAQTESAYESAQANYKQSQIQLEKTTITAPFDGILGPRYVDIGDYLRVGDEVSNIVDLDPLEVNLFVSEKEIVQIAEGNTAQLLFTGGEERQGRVIYIAPSADEDNRTFQVKIEIENTDNPLPAGLTAQIEIEVASREAYQIAPSVLTLNDSGDIGVKTVNADNVVVFTPITILDDTSGNLWVSGLDGEVRIVQVGQDFIVPGQQVDPLERGE